MYLANKLRIHIENLVRVSFGNCVIFSTPQLKPIFYSTIGSVMMTSGPRKFLPVSSSQFKTPKPKWQASEPGRHSSQTSFYAKQQSSSQFVKTPRFSNNPNDAIDDIDGSFEDRQSSSTELNPRRTAKAASSIYDDEDENLDSGIQHLSRPQTRNDDYGTDGTPSNRNVSKHKDTIQDVDEDDFPQPTSKRLKTSSTSTTHKGAILISSSESEEVLDNHSSHEMEAVHFKNSKPVAKARYHAETDVFDFNSDSDGDSDLSDLSPSPIHATSCTFIPRFKIPTAPPPTTLPNTKPVFKPPLPSQNASNTTLLPDAFSPSRRRGKRDYVQGGYADTVRNWVLELRTSLSKPSKEEAKIFRVVNVRHDLEGKCATVLGENGQEWLLVSQGQHADPRSVGVGDVVEISGSETSWRINLRGEGVEENEGRSVDVSVFWKVKR